MQAINKKKIEQFCSSATKHPFTYNISVKLIPNPQSSEYMICCHGSGANNQIADSVKSYRATTNNIMSFNFPDHDNNASNPHASSFGTISELLPFIYVLKNIITLGNLPSINLYGFSAGAAVIINSLTVLTSTTYDKNLEAIGITQADKATICAALQKGLIILDAPLKSIEEIIALRGNNPVLQKLALTYHKNNFRPIDSITRIGSLKLTILLYFELPDEIVSNRDDALFGNLLKQYNTGTTRIITGSSGGHCAMHTALWNAYKQLLNG